MRTAQLPARTAGNAGTTARRRAATAPRDRPAVAGRAPTTDEAQRYVPAGGAARPVASLLELGGIRVALSRAATLGRQSGRPTDRPPTRRGPYVASPLAMYGVFLLLMGKSCPRVSVLRTGAVVEGCPRITASSTQVSSARGRDAGSRRPVEVTHFPHECRAASSMAPRSVRRPATEDGSTGTQNSEASRPLRW